MDIGCVLNVAEQSLKSVGIDTPRLDAKLLLAHVLDCQPQMLGLRRAELLTPDQHQRFQTLLDQRRQRQPVSQIVGSRGFWTLDLHVTRDTLDPRPDSESLIEAVLEHLPEETAPLNVLDFGTGTGCLLLAVLAEYPHAQGVGVDISPAALAVAQGNAERCGLSGRVQLVRSRWGNALGGERRFQLILSNPPYIPEAQIDGLEPEVTQWEPRLALSGGDDGLECYREVLPHMARLLVVGGLAVLEVGAGQAPDVAALGQACGLDLVGFRRDLGGVDRCVILKCNNIEKTIGIMSVSD